MTVDHRLYTMKMVKNIIEMRTIVNRTNFYKQDFDSVILTNSNNKRVQIKNPSDYLIKMCEKFIESLIRPVSIHSEYESVFVSLI